MNDQHPIPREAVDAAARQIHTGFDTAAPIEQHNARETAMEALAAARPLLLAVELERLAVELERRSDNVALSASNRGGIEFMATLRETAERVRARATALRGEFRG